MRKSIRMIGKISLSIAIVTGCFQCTPKETSCEKSVSCANVQDTQGVQKEFLDRGFVAFTRADTSVYLGWRLLEDDPEDVAFNLYRKMIGAVPDNDYVKVNREPITRSTNYVDKGSDYYWLEGTTPKVHEAHRYKLTRIVGGKEEDVAGGETYVFLSLGDRNYRSILLNDINSSASKIGIGDLDGDGAYDFVLLLNPLQYVDPGTCEDCWYRSRDTYKLEAYSSTGKFLWRYDLGWSIETGLWYAPFIVYDLDGDGRAEVYIKGGEGDPRELDGRVMTGPEYLLKIDGVTGKVVQKRPWIPRNIEKQRSYDWTSRNHMGLAYLDGKRPSLLMQRGNYGIIKVEALDRNLRTEWVFSTDEYENCWGCGGHNIRVADIDEDGKDEILPGTFAIDDNGKPLWSLQLFHNDGSEVADIDPDRPGLEIFFNIETGLPRNGVCMVDAATGEFIMEYDKPTGHVHDQATVADFDPKYPGMECYADADRGDTHPFLYSAKGERISDSFYLNARPLYWDDDEYKELLENGKVYKFGGDTLSRDIYDGYICDLFGDWREESIACLRGEIRIYSTTVPADNRKVTLMQDHQYRMGAASYSSGYSTSPQLGLAKDAKHKYPH
ncbi:MAG: silent information regulator protein Sir2 [Tannerella sp.]|nr:silent information regulator protein Sir2 [Tannerella sp.]